MPKKWLVAGALAAASAITLAGAGVANAATNPNTCFNLSACGTSDVSVGSFKTIYCDWDATGPVKFIRSWQNGTVIDHAASGNKGTIVCGSSGFAGASFHGEAWMQGVTSVIHVGVHTS